MKAVTVHRGARDSYQVALALEEAGLLQKLVTDLYWPADGSVAKAIEKVTPRKAVQALRCRYAPGLPASSVSSCWLSGSTSLLVSKMKGLPFGLGREATRWCDRNLGQRVGQIANRSGAAILSYSYYAHSAFSSYSGDQPRILFQLHPHPVSIRKILQRELELHPDCKSSLDKEWELSLPQEDFDRLVEEVAMAQHWIVASTFTKKTLIENGIPGERIAVVPYGIDLERFSPKKVTTAPRGPLQLLFVGTLAQRKGIKYLLQALELLPTGSVELTVCGRAVDDLAIFRNSKLPIRLHPSISAEGLLEAYRAADVFVFPSLAEGFAHVLLEAMASGLPIISTNRTAAPDLIQHGREGFLVKPGDAYDLAQKIEEFLLHPELVRSMSNAARLRAEHFTWRRFRLGIVDFVNDLLHPSMGMSNSEPCLSH